MTDTEANKALVKRYFTAIEEGDLTALDEVVSTDYQDHAPGRQPGRGALKAAAQTLRAAFPDMTSTVTHMLAEGDLIAVRNRVTGTQHGPLGEHSRRRATASTSPRCSYFASKTSSSLNTGRSSTKPPSRNS